MQQYLARAQVLRDRADETGDPELAECVAVAFCRTHDIDQLDGSLSFYNEFDEFEQDCLSAT